MLVATDYLTIGQIARLSGLTTKALRHYDRLGVLRPAEVDEWNGYRRYGTEQVERARQIRVLRELELPLEEIRRILDDPDSEEAAAQLAEHRRRIGARLTELQTVFYFLGKLIDGKEIEEVTLKRPTSVSLEPELQRKLAADLFNHTWTLLEKADRSERETDLMIAATHAQRFFWEEIGEPANHARGEWQIARVYSTVGRAEPALYHAQRCLQICEEHGIGDWDLAFAYEGLARAYAVAGESDASARYEAQAREAAEHIAEADDRELLLGDLDTLPR
jgi:DNA-binding transcriptional MerR regulator